MIKALLAHQALLKLRMGKFVSLKQRRTKHLLWISNKLGVLRRLGMVKAGRDEGHRQKLKPNQKKELGHSLAIGSVADGPSDAKFGVGDTRMHEASIFCLPGQTNSNFPAYQNSSFNLCFCRY